MKILIGVLFAISLFTISLFAQYHWQNPSQAGQRIHDMQFIDSLTGYACGYGGLFLNTTDGGNHWFDKQVPEEELIVDLYFLNRDIGWILYYLPDKLYITTDGGNSWKFMSDLLSRDASFVYFLDEQNGFAGGSTGALSYMLKTTDGGFTWTDETEVNDCYSIFFLNHNTGFVGSTNTLYRTTDAGNTWTSTGFTYLSFTPWDIYAYDQANIYCVGYGTDPGGTDRNVFLNTSNGGTTWDTLSFDNYLSDVFFKTPSNGFICEGYKLLETTNRGMSWDTTHVFAEEFQFMGNKSWSYFFNTISYSEDEWHTSIPQINSIFTGFITDGCAEDTNKVFACGSNTTILGTIDGGKNWSKLYSSATNDLLNGIIIKNNEIWSVGDHGRVIFSRDNGTTWTEKTIEDNWLGDITFISDSTGFIVGTHGSSAAIYITQDRGENWSLLQEFTELSSLNKIKFSRDDLGWAAGYPQAILKTTDKGRTWLNVIDTIYAPSEMAVSGDTAWFTYWNKILRTTNAGTTWQSFSVFDYAGSTFNNTDIDFINSKIGYECTYDSRVFKSTDGGVTWSEENFPRGINNFALDFVNENKGWIFGWPGTIVNRDPFYVSVENFTYNIPEEYILYQNYPNPFNPATTISYQISEAGRVTLKVYDILGREVAILVNEHKTKGRYSVKFEAASLTSGVYIYQIRINNYVRSGKMLLLK